tara:strand:- start:1826 stop:2188 length:363 start_codon:yes stop_codon:yes gene_type:complete
MDKRKLTVLTVLFLAIFVSTSASAKLRGAKLRAGKVAKANVFKSQNSVMIHNLVLNGPVVNYLVATGAVVVSDGKILSTNDEGETSEYSSVEEYINAQRGYCQTVKVVGESTIGYWEPCN